MSGARHASLFLDMLAAERGASKTRLKPIDAISTITSNT